MEPVNSGFTTVKKVWSLLSEKEENQMWVRFNSLPNNNTATGCCTCRGVTWMLELWCCPLSWQVWHWHLWVLTRSEKPQWLLCSEINSQVSPYSRELVTLILFKDWVQGHSLSQCSRVPADQMHLQSLKVMFLEEMCMKIPAKAHKPWFIYMGISKYKSEFVHKHWSFHTYMQAKYTKSNTFSERDLCKNMYSNCRPPSRHT